MNNDKDYLITTSSKDKSEHQLTDPVEGIDKSLIKQKIINATAESQKIERMSKHLISEIFDFGGRFDKYLGDYKSDFMTAFKDFLETTIRKEFRQKIEEIEKAEKEKRRLNDIRIIKTERDFFRQEAIRLNNLCKELGSKVDKLTSELKFQTRELLNLTKKWKDSENTNKQLIFELERNIQFNKELDDRYNQLLKENNPENEMNPLRQKNFQEVIDLNQLGESQNFVNYNKEKLIKIIDKLKNELKKEKSRNHKILCEFNKLSLNKDFIENIFESCVEEVRKDIHERKIKDILINKNSSAFDSKEIKLENFLFVDKKKLLEKFILDDQVVNFIKDHLKSKKPEEINFMKFYKTSKDFNKSHTSIMRTDFKFRTNHKLKIKSPNGNRLNSVYNRSQILL